MPKARPRNREGRKGRYRYVHWWPPSQRWVVQATRGGELFRLASFEREIDAAKAADRLILYLDGPGASLNFPKADVRPASLEQLTRELRTAQKRKTSSRYVGVTHESGNALPWTARLSTGKGLALGRYATERDAAIARDRAVLFYKPERVRLNFPKLKLTPASAEQLAEERKKQKPPRAGGVTSRGVRWSAGAFLAQYKGRHLGSFATEAEAARAYDKEVQRARRKD
jgi:hypothetical protein